MIGACEKMSLNSKTLFVAASILDKYLLKRNNSLPQDDLYLVSITTLHIACKYEEILKIPLSFIMREVGKG